MADIYQQIWDADQSGAGVKPILDTAEGNAASGYVKVNSKLDAVTPELRVLPEAVIPESKMHTYHLCRRLFDNYALSEKDEEVETPAEREEVHDLLHAMVDTVPMQVAREYVAARTGTGLTRERWYNTLMEMWFRRFSMGGDPALSGFEHVVVGEQEGPVAQGYHFWYKYYLDDGFAHQVEDACISFPGLEADRIIYLGSKLSNTQQQFPETVTISYKWNAPDYDREVLRPLTKKVGGFFVGCSVEGLLAMGTVRAHIGARAPKEAIINGARYSMKVYRSNNNHHVRTFYPVFLGAAGAEEGGGQEPVHSFSTGPVRIIAALINPEGEDKGNESVTLINTGVSSLALDGWSLRDKNANTMGLDGYVLPAGETLRLVLSGKNIQLSNKGGSIILADGNGGIVNTVTYSKGQARGSGLTILF